MGRRGRRRRTPRRKLVRRYGYFECDRCGNEWQSCYVFVYNYGYVQDCDEEEVAYGQKCRKCHWINDPYLVEPLKCSFCDAVDCVCDPFDKENRHINKRIPHKEDLCMKCRAGLPCINDNDDDEYCPCY